MYTSLCAITLNDDDKGSSAQLCFNQPSHHRTNCFIGAVGCVVVCAVVCVGGLDVVVLLLLLVLWLVAMCVIGVS